MILGIGIDSIEIARFSDWQHYCPKTLSRVFSDEEIAYCLENPIKTAERLAVRFAAKEAFYKAFCAAFPELNIRGPVVFRHISITHKKNGHSSLKIEWSSIFKEFLQKFEALECKLSLTHTKALATAFIIIEKK